MFSPGQPSGGGGGQHLQGYWGEGYRRQTLLFDHWWKDREGDSQLHRLAVAKLYLDRYTDDYIWVIPRSITVVNKTRFANSLSANAFRKCTAGNKERSPCLVIHNHFYVLVDLSLPSAVERHFLSANAALGLMHLSVFLLLQNDTSLWHVVGAYLMYKLHL